MTICPHLPIWIEELTSLLIQNINDFCLNRPGFKAKAFYYFYIKNKEITWVFMVAQTVKNPPAMQETWVWSLGWKDPWRRKWQPASVFLPGKSHSQRNLAGYSSWSHKKVRHNLTTKQQQEQMEWLPNSVSCFLKWEVFSVHKPYLVSKSIALSFCRDKSHCEAPTQ